MIFTIMDEQIREISIILDEWSRTCDQVLKSLEEQINKVSKRR